jgi:AcrR family transcriptional regulator
MPETRERLVRAAYEEFLQQGFNAVGIDQILRTVGVTKTTFYNHFESKDALVAAVLRWRDEVWPETLDRIFEERGIADPVERLLTMFSARDEIMAIPRNSTGIFTRAACEYASGQGEVRQALRAHRAALGGTLLRLARETGVKDPEGLMREMKLVIAGVSQLNQLGETESVTETSVRVAEGILARYLPKGRTGSKKPLKKVAAKKAAKKKPRR